MKSAVFVTVRSKSSRLPAKAYLEINGRPTIAHVIERAKKTQGADIVVVCTTDNPEDDEICRIAESLGVSFFRGSELDKLSRWLAAAKLFDVSYFATADGDDLFCEPVLNSLAIKQMENSAVDFIQSSIVIPGAFTYAIRTSALQKVCEIKNTEDTEMMWVYFTQTGLFLVEELQGDILDYSRKGVRITLDYQEDFDFFNYVFEKLEKKFPDMPLLEVLKFLDENPNVTKINSSFNSIWSNNQVQRTKLVLKPEYEYILKGNKS